MPDSTITAGRYDRLSLVLLALYAALLFTGTHLPGVPTAAVGLFSHDKLVHFGAYAVLGCLVAVCVTPRGGRLALVSGILIVLGIAVVGAIDELTQPYVGRSCDERDWLADVVGAAVGVGAYGWWSRWRRG
ncbi:MAG: VanZ family protein [Planctomycetota bacterium]